MREETIVLKFGSSVLRGPDDLLECALEAYRWTRRGLGVVAVVSAFSGRTDALLAEARRGNEGPGATARRVAAGEEEAARALGAELERCGVAAEVLDAATLGLRVAGPPLDARPVGFGSQRVAEALATGRVVVVPGFVGVDAAGGVALLGRGGSDATAVFLARWLRARCRLVKDVAGLFEADPAHAPSARRFARATFADALRCGGRVVQAKAVALAGEHATPFEIGAALRDDATLVGADASRFAADAGARRPLRVALLGRGAVGRQVERGLSRLAPRFELAGIAVRDASRHAADLSDTPLLAGGAVAGLDADCVVDVTGDLAFARTQLHAALRRGCHAVTAGKALLARHGAWLDGAARRSGARLLGSAAVGGALPVLETASRLRGDVVLVRAVLNGTTNFVLERLAAGADLPDAIAEARRLGLCERDPSRDLDGLDAAEKLVLLARALGHPGLDPDAIPRRRFAARGAAVARRKQVATLRLEGAGPARAAVALEDAGAGDPLADAHGAGNVVVFERSGAPPVVLRGLGAGGAPAALAVLADLADVADRTGSALAAREHLLAQAEGFR